MINRFRHWLAFHILWTAVKIMPWDQTKVAFLRCLAEDLDGKFDD